MPREVVYARGQCQIWKKAYCKRTARNDSNASIVRKIFLSSIAKGTADPGVDCLIQSAYRVLYILHILHIHRIYNFTFVHRSHLPVTGFEGRSPVDHFPLDVEGGAPGLELPDVGAQLGLVLLVWNDIYYAFFAYFTIYASRLD